VLQLIAGRYRSWQGEAEFRGQALARRHRTAIALVSSDDAAPASTVYQWLLRGGVAPSRGMLWQRALGLAPARSEALRRRRSALRMLVFLGLDEHADWPVAKLAPALRWRLALAAAMAAEPKLLLIDEPTLELDAAARREMVQLIRRINQRFGTTIVLAEHDAEVALGLCDRLIVMDQGRQWAEGAPGELASAIADAYRAEAGRN
jgi:branched-chain amino acid transport system ATP-binding protein